MVAVRDTSSDRDQCCDLLQRLFLLELKTLPALFCAIESGGHQGPGVGLLGRLEEEVSSALLHHTALMHNNQCIGPVHGQP
jgi:hypothetical protein